jgi:hypothetical protein
MRVELDKAREANDAANQFALSQAIVSLGSVFAGEAEDPPPAPPKSSDRTLEYYSRTTETYKKGREIQRTMDTLWRMHVDDAKIPQGCDGLCELLKKPKN